MAGAMKFNLTCPRCGGTGQAAQRVSDLRRRRPRHADRRPWKCASRPGRSADRGCACRARAMPGTHGRVRRAICTSRFASSRIHSSERDGDNIEIKVPVAVWEAGLGAKIEVPTIDGRALLKIPQGTQNGQKFRLREKGVFNARKNSRGDQIVEVALQAPEVQDERTREIAARTGELQKGSARGNLGQSVVRS